MSVQARIKYKEIEQTFAGNADDVWISINHFFNHTIPTFKIAENIILTTDLEKIIKASKNIVAVSREGPVVLASKNKLTDIESLLLMLLSAYIGCKMGVSDRLWLSRDELKGWLGKSRKITGTRLGELCRQGLITKTTNGYHLTVFGIKKLTDEVLPLIEAKM